MRPEVPLNSVNTYRKPLTMPTAKIRGRWAGAIDEIHRLTPCPPSRRLSAVAKAPKLQVARQPSTSWKKTFGSYYASAEFSVRSRDRLIHSFAIDSKRGFRATKRRRSFSLA
jgi:hypothetical protein